MADVKRFIIIGPNGQLIEQTNNMTIEVDAGLTARSVVNKEQLETAISTLGSDLNAAIDAEEARALAAEANLQAQLTAEIADRTAADTALGVRIDTEEAARLLLDTTLRGLLSTEETARIATDTALQASLDAEIVNRTTADTTLQTNIDAEAALRVSGDAALTAALNAEIASRQDADSALQAEIDAEESLRSTEITRVEGLISTEQAARIAADTAEQAARENADATLTTNLAAEITRATGEEARIEAKYDAGIAAEIAARLDGDATNAAAITAETNRALAAEAGINLALSAEVARATGREDTIETALNAEVSRATAEEIAVENRAKAYADARVQGLKNKDSVDFAFTRFVPNFDRENEGNFTPKFRFGQSWPVGAADPAIEIYDEFGADSLGYSLPYMQFDDTGSNSGWYALVAPLDGGAPGFQYILNGAYVKDGVTIDESPTNAYYDFLSNQNPTTQARWNNCLNNGVFVMQALVEIVDTLADDNLEQLFLRMSEADETVSGARVAIVQNNVGAVNDWWLGMFPESMPTQINTYSHYLVDDAIEALPKHERVTAMQSYVDPSAAEDHPWVDNGVYRRTLTAGVASWTRAADFADGQEVSGSYVLVEKGIRGGPAETSGVHPSSNYYYSWSFLDQRKLTAPNTGIVFNAVGEPTTSATVGTHMLIATVFNRVGAYQFTEGLARNPADPTVISVLPDRSTGIRTGSGGVSFDLQDLSNLEFKRLSDDYDPNHKGLSLTGPLVSGFGSSIERAENAGDNRWSAHADKKGLHSHEASYLVVDFWPVKRAEDLSINGIIPAGTLVAAANVSFGPESAPYGTRDSIAVATWDAPGYIGVTDWREDITAWTEAASTSYEYDTGVKGRVALAGSGALRVIGKINFVSWDLSSFAVGAMIYVGAGTDVYGLPVSTIAHFSDIPSGKWAIPVGIKLNESEIKLVDRPAFLKA